jgi:hypothetical protein
LKQNVVIIYRFSKTFPIFIFAFSSIFIPIIFTVFQFSSQTFPVLIGQSDKISKTVKLNDGELGSVAPFAEVGAIDDRFNVRAAVLPGADVIKPFLFITDAAVAKKVRVLPRVFFSLV